MKALIVKRGNERGRYYKGRNIKEIVKKFMQNKPNLVLIKIEDYTRRYDLFTIDTKTDRWVFYSIPKNKIIK